MLSEENKLQKVLAERNRLIDQLDRALLTKEEFHAENYRVLTRMQMKPYAQICRLEQGIYNYQYYNTLAKQEQRKAQSAPAKNRGKIEQAVRNYFDRKDEAIRQMLAHCPQEPVEAYFIFTESTNLHGRLLEIVFPAREKVVLHTLNPEIIETVKRLGIFREEVRISRIHSYINAQKEEVR